MGLFTPAQLDKINKSAEKSKQALEKPVPQKTKSINADLNRISDEVIQYFKDSPAILITSKSQLHEYITKCIEYGYAGIDTETTGLDRIKDTIVGASLYVPGMPECYIPSKHLVPIFNQPYSDQLSYEDIGEEFQRLVEAKTKMIFANADFDISMIYKDLKVDFADTCYFDVILAWRCLKENELDNTLKTLYNKYVLRGKGDPKHFSDFFPPSLFPFCKPEVAKLYAANDAKITFDLFMWELPYLTKENLKCQKQHLEQISDLFWNIEMPMVKVCAMLHRRGAYVQKSTTKVLLDRYRGKLLEAEAKLAEMVQAVIDKTDYSVMINCPFKIGKQFGYNSPKDVKYLCFDMLGLEKASSLDKEQLALYNNPICNQILECRGLQKLVGTYVEKLPKETTDDSRIHAQFKSVGADCITGDSILPTSNGYRTIQEICESANCREAEHVLVEGLVIVNRDQVAESAQSVIKYTDYPTIKITTECGFTLEGTYNHPIMVSSYTAADCIDLGKPKQLAAFWDDRKFKTLEEVSVGDYVEIPCNYYIGPTEYVCTNLTLHPPYQTSKTVATLPEVYDEAFAEFLGMYHADGSAYLRDGTYTISISNDDADVIQRVDELSLSLFNVTTSHYTAQAANHEVETYINCIQIKDVDKILSHGKQHKKIPEAIWRSPKSVINSYIKGLTLDSSVYIDENGRVALELSVINNDDARMIQYHLASQGILCYMSYNENKDGWLSPRLGFNADNYILFRDLIGFVESKKYKITEPCMKNKYVSRRINDSFRLRIKSIECRTNTVYDLHVPNTHSFVSNGFISHNTGRMSSASPNLQNIPSHATDIRHMFRATPGTSENVVMTDVSETLSVSLAKVDKVLTDEGLKEVIELQIGDVITLQRQGVPVKRTLLQITADNNVSKLTLVFKKEE